MNRLSVSILALLLVSGVVGVLADESTDLSLAEVQRLIAERGESWTAGPTGVSELPAESKRRLAGLVIPPEAARLEATIPLITAPDKVDLPARWDWRESVPGVHPVGVTPVKNQLTCSSCWAFAAAAQLESHILITDGIVTNLSEQQLISCNHTGGSCVGGGWHLDAYSVFTAPGAVRESCFPYEDADTACDHWDCPVIARIAGYSRVSNDLDSIKYALMDGPLFVGIRWQEMFAFYKSGVYHVPQADPPSMPVSYHTVVLVGWDDTIEHSYGTGAWIVKNSWGDEWGMEGYAYVSYTSALLHSGPRQITYLPQSTSHLVLDEPQGGETWVAGTNHRVSWVTDLAADRYEVGYLIGGQYQVVEPAVPDTASQCDIQAPDARAEDLLVRVTALGPGGEVLATAETDAAIYLVNHRVAWPPDGVTVPTGSDAARPHALVPDGEGGCLLVWTGAGGSAITRIAADGQPVWPSPRALPSGIDAGVVLGDDAGGAFLAYSWASGGNHQLWLLRVAADGSLPWGSSGRRVDHLGGEFATGHSVGPLLCGDGNGGVICVWNFYASSFCTVYGQRFNAAGEELWEVGDAPGHRLTLRPGAGPSALTGTSDGEAVVAYICFGDDSYDRTDLWVQRVQESGELPWGELGRRARAGVGYTESHALSASPDGGVALAWREADMGWSKVLLQRFATGGEAAWSEGGRTVDALEVAGRLELELVDDELGGQLVSVAKQTSLCEVEVTVHRFDQAGNRVWPSAGVVLDRCPGLVGYLGLGTALTADGAGGAIVLWTRYDAEVPGGRSGIKAQHVTADGSLDWTPHGEPIVLSHEVPVRYSQVCRDRTGHVSLAWSYSFATPTVQFQRIAGTFAAPPRCEITAWRRRDGELQPLEEGVLRGCPAGDADALVLVCDFVDADLEGVPLVSPADLAIDTSALGISLGSVTAADQAGTPDNGYTVTLVRDQVLGCSACDGDGCADATRPAGPLPLSYQGRPVGVVPAVAVHGLDVSGDGAVDLTELIGLAWTYNRSQGDPGFDSCYDVDGDALVDLSDAVLLLAHLGTDPATGGEAILSLRPTGPGGGAHAILARELVLHGDDARAAAVRIRTGGAPASTLTWLAGAADAVLLPAAADAVDEAWLVLPRLVGVAGGETVLGRLVLPEAPPVAEDARGLSLVGGEFRHADGRTLALAIASAPPAEAGGIRLAPPYPNPSNPNTTITFSASQGQRLSLRIYDLAGRLVRTLAEGPLPAASGPRRITWTGRDESGRAVSSGVYFVRLSVDGETATQRLMLIR